MIFVFGDCELDLTRGELRRRGEVSHIEPQVFAMLAHLVEHRDRLVTSSDLLAHVWQRRFVTPATLNSRLKAARQAIGDDGREQKFIRTLCGRGFRFVAPVQVRNGSAQARPTPSAPPARTPLNAIEHAVPPADAQQRPAAPTPEAVLAHPPWLP